MIAFKNNDWIHTSDLSSADLSSFSMVTDPASESDECGSGALLATAASCIDCGLLEVVTRVTTWCPPVNRAGAELHRNVAPVPKAPALDIPTSTKHDVRWIIGAITYHACSVKVSLENWWRHFCRRKKKSKRYASDKKGVRRQFGDLKKGGTKGAQRICTYYTYFCGDIPVNGK